jgi:ribonuclease HII
MRKVARAASTDRFAFERPLLAAGRLPVAGLDEAGRGPLAGPVVAAAVALPIAWIRDGVPTDWRALNDSKQLTPALRESFYVRLVNHPEVRFSIAWTDAARIDTINILRATHEAMAMALLQLQPAPVHVLVDGLAVPGLSCPQTALVAGDARSYSIAAASVLAKVTRDRRMVELDRLHPGYGFAAHKGYGTPEHLAALRRLGPCDAHRRTFAPLKPTQTELALHVPVAPHQVSA